VGSERRWQRLSAPFIEVGSGGKKGPGGSINCHVEVRMEGGGTPAGDR
jgi:hypothetical protein